MPAPVKRPPRTPTKRFFPVDENVDYTTQGRKPTRQRVRIKSLTATQSGIHAGFRTQKNPTKGPISVYRSPQGKDYIIEGHHRTARAAVRGAKHIKAYVYREAVKKAAIIVLADAIEKAGLIRSGKPPLHRRIGFLLSTNRSERNYKIGRYLESRKAGKGFGPKGKRRARVGNYSGVYATGVNKSEHVMSAIDLLDDAIEKARAGARSGMIPYGSRHQYGRAKFFEARAKRRGDTSELAQRGSRARAYLAHRSRGGKGPGGSTRRGFYKSAELPMTDAVEELYDVIEKAGKGLIRGGSRKTLRGLSRQSAKQSDKAGQHASNSAYHMARGNWGGIGRSQAGYSAATRRVRRLDAARGYLAGRLGRGRVYKSDSIDLLDEAIEKASGRGLMPKGGSLKVFARLPAGGARAKRLKTYLLRRTANIEGRVKRKT